MLRDVFTFIGPPRATVTDTTCWR